MISSSGNDQVWRNPLRVVNQLADSSLMVTKNQLQHKVDDGFWEALAATGLSLLVSREYEHFLLCLGCGNKGPDISYMCLPHPSGIAVDKERRCVYVASTRNPNLVYELAASAGLQSRADLGRFGKRAVELEGCLIPWRIFVYPGSLYIHDLALIKGRLFANAVAHNAVVRLDESGGVEYAWWPRSMQQGKGPCTDQNFLQLNSIAAGRDLESSFFSASCSEKAKYRPGHRYFRVDGEGVIFSGRSGDPVCRGLTRPHSARIHQGKVWVDNSGYGQVGFVDKGRLNVVAALPGWTRGLFFCGNTLFVGVSRVLPKFRQYAPGLDVKKSFCGIYAIDINSGKTIGRLIWQEGDQIFAVEGLPREMGRGLMCPAGRPLMNEDGIGKAFYGFNKTTWRG
ncbi:MAG: DUF4915 domain-containing protein [Candidatus Omnitrophica bacterium]|nr:DUF4915 domain-containing protein [Candidatus Omnitrophota bacterium]